MAAVVNTNDGVPLCYERRGKLDGPLVVLVHGTWSFGKSFVLWHVMLYRRCACLGSPLTDANNRLERLAAVFYALLRCEATDT